MDTTEFTEQYVSGRANTCSLISLDCRVEYPVKFDEKSKSEQ